MTTLTPTPLVLSLSVMDPWTGPKPVRVRIMEEIGRRLKKILLTNGYLTNAGASVNYGQLYSPTIETIPCIHYWDGSEVSTRDYGMDNKELVINLELYDRVATGPQIQERANRLLSDATKAVMRDPDSGQMDPTLKGLADSLLYQSSEPMPGISPDLFWTGVSIDFLVVYKTRAGDPTQKTEEE